MDKSLLINYCGFPDFSLKDMVVLIREKPQLPGSIRNIRNFKSSVKDVYRWVDSLPDYNPEP